LPGLPMPVCAPDAADYHPGATDSWAPCISDDGVYHLLGASVSSAQRVRAFEDIAALLFDPSRDPSPDDFLAARVLYQEDQGLDSRVVRRYDPHFSVPSGTDCTLPGVPEAEPDYCVGPATLQPLLLAAFAAGYAPETAAPRYHAGRIEAGLLWFFYVSTSKESLTCTGSPGDCDSAWAYYTGAEPAPGGIGLAGRIAAVDPEAHAEALLGALALRCWRDLDPAPMASDLILREAARTQYDTALLRGMARLVRAHALRLCESRDGELLYHWGFVRTLLPALLREARLRDPAAAARLQLEAERSQPSEIDVVALIEALDFTFPCP
ncbi:MAG: hypothetical protein OEY14_04915, partial [Myxococcales bacterium]|nr:hypothetical protein [Myxococcales bacterium]